MAVLASRAHRGGKKPFQRSWQPFRGTLKRSPVTRKRSRRSLKPSRGSLKPSKVTRKRFRGSLEPFQGTRKPSQGTLKASRGRQNLPFQAEKPLFPLQKPVSGCLDPFSSPKLTSGLPRLARRGAGNSGNVNGKPGPAGSLPLVGTDSTPSQNSGASLGRGGTRPYRRPGRPRAGSRECSPHQTTAALRAGARRSPRARAVPTTSGLPALGATPTLPPTTLWRPHHPQSAADLNGRNHSHTMSLALDVSQILDPLIDAWCARRALRPLRFILGAYPRPQWLTDDCFQLLEALKNTKGLCCDMLPSEERAALTRAMILLQDALENR